MATPLPLPANFNPDTCTPSNVTENGVFHESRRGAALAAQLVANGTPQDIDLALKVLGVALSCQECRDGNPHYGNFIWMSEVDVVQDPNAVEFNLEHLIPMMLAYGNRLPPETGRYVAASHGAQPEPLKLTVSNGEVVVPSMGAGILVWDNGRAVVEAIGLQGKPVVRGGTLVDVRTTRSH